MCFLRALACASCFSVACRGQDGSCELGDDGEMFWLCGAGAELGCGQCWQNPAGIQELESLGPRQWFLALSPANIRTGLRKITVL